MKQHLVVAALIALANAKGKKGGGKDMTKHEWDS